MEAGRLSRDGGVGVAHVLAGRVAGFRDACAGGFRDLAGARDYLLRAMCQCGALY